jgi:exopolysaccharide production protein ExoQ
MPPRIALFVFICFIFFLIRNNIKQNPSVSNAIWVPFTWLVMIGSRALAGWRNTEGSSAELYSEGNAVDRNILILIITSGIIILIKRKLPWAQIIRSHSWTLVFLIYCLLSIFWSDSPFIASKRLVRGLGVIVMVLVILTEKEPIEALVAIWKRLAFLLIPMSVLFIRFYPELGRTYNKWTYEVSYCGVCGNKNELGALCMITGIIILWNFQRMWENKTFHRKSLSMWADMTIMAMVLYLLRIAHSATSLTCFIVGITVLVIVNLPMARKNAKYLSGCLIGVLILLLLLQLGFNIKGNILAALGRNETLTDRTPLWNAILHVDINPFFGAGYESFWTGNRLVYFMEHFGAIQSHNGYIDTYMNLGIFGLLLLLAMIISAFIGINHQLFYAYNYARLRLTLLIIFLLYNVTEAGFPRAGIICALFFLICYTPFQFNRNVSISDQNQQ